MNILMITQAYYPFLAKGGPAVKVRAIALGLAKQGHSVSVVTSDWGFAPSMAPEMSARKCDFGWRGEESGVVTIFLRNYGHYGAVSLNPGAIRFAFGRLQAFDVAHVYGLYDLLGPTVTFFCRKNHMPYVVEPMGMYRPIVRNLGLKRVYHRMLGRSFLSAAQCLIATSEQEKMEMLAEGVDCGRIVVRRNGVELPHSLPERGAFRQQWGIPSNAKVILFLGRLEAKKSPELLLSAFSKYRKDSPSGSPSLLIISGPERDPGYVNRLSSLAVSLNITDAVRFTGPLYGNNKWSAYRDADVFVLPSQNENFGNSAAEAIACGTPVIVTDQCGIAPMIAGKAGVVVPRELNAIAHALQAMLDHSELALRFRNACREVASSLSWEEPLSQMVEIYRHAIPKRACA